MDYLLKLDKVSKIYDDKVVVRNVSFEIEKGKVYGLLGPNGAGKTTIMKIIMNQVKCDRGSVLCDNNLKIKYLQDVPQFYEFYSVEEYLRFILDICHYGKDKEIRINEVLDLLNLKEYKDIKIKLLSRGLRQKVGIASVIIDEADVLILDEPISALDPIGRKEMFDVILSLKGKITIIFSSHIVNDVERVCDHVILINKGKIIFNQSITSQVLEKKTLLVVFQNKDDLIRIKDKIEYECYYNSVIENCLEIEIDEIDRTQKVIFKMLLDNEIVVNSISLKKDSLEEIFLREVSKNV